MRLWYEEQGTGPAVVLIHGGGMDARMWDGQMAALARTHRVIRYDVRGFGRSEWPTRSFAHVEDLAGLLDHVGVERASLVGLSLGGSIAIDFALTHPERIDRLVLAGAGVSGWTWSPEVLDHFRVIAARARAEGLDAATDEWLRDPHMVPVMQHPAVAPRVRAISRDNARAWLGGAAPARPIHPPAIGRLAEVRAPTLVLIGGRDIADLRRIATLLDRGIPHSRKVVIPEAGHIINMEAQAKFNRIVAAFLRVVP